MDAVARTLAAYRPSTSDEASDVERVMALVGEHDPWDRRTPLHLTASALVVDPSRALVLLRWHTRMRQWMQVGGHGDAGESDPWLVALREAREETGLLHLEALRPTRAGQPVQVVVVPVPASATEPAHEHADIRYALSTNAADAAAAEAPEAPLKWLTFDAARAEVREENLREFLLRVERLAAAND